MNGARSRPATRSLKGKVLVLMATIALAAAAPEADARFGGGGFRGGGFGGLRGGGGFHGFGGGGLGGGRFWEGGAHGGGGSEGGGLGKVSPRVEVGEACSAVEDLTMVCSEVGDCFRIRLAIRTPG